MSFQLKADVAGVENLVRQLKDMQPNKLHGILKETQLAAVSPLHVRILTTIYNIVGKHDGESMERALQHRWRRNKRGRPVKYSRMYIIRQLLKQPVTGRSAFGLKWAIFPQKNGSYARVKIWNPGLRLIDVGRTKTNTYKGWDKLKNVFAQESTAILPKFMAEFSTRLENHILMLQMRNMDRDRKYLSKLRRSA
jgi:hypothetical protein